MLTQQGCSFLRAQKQKSLLKQMPLKLKKTQLAVLKLKPVDFSTIQQKAAAMVQAVFDPSKSNPFCLGHRIPY